MLFFAFSLAFAIKVPFPFHTWVPQMPVEAPAPGSVILAGVRQKWELMDFCVLLYPCSQRRQNTGLGCFYFGVDLEYYMEHRCDGATRY